MISHRVVRLELGQDRADQAAACRQAKGGLRPKRSKHLKENVRREIERERSAPWRSRKILDGRLPTERTSVSQSVEWDTYRAGMAKTTSTRQVILTRRQKFRSPF